MRGESREVGTPNSTLFENKIKVDGVLSSVPGYFDVVFNGTARRQPRMVFVEESLQ
jgi:hypothetical protein